LRSIEELEMRRGATCKAIIRLRFVNVKRVSILRSYAETREEKEKRKKPALVRARREEFSDSSIRRPFVPVSMAERWSATVLRH